ncbi:MAG: UvrD-helicase domain-containing protein [Bacteroidales bacterium]|nr:UvrD-helicase domain-containing protein [Bacteroidales bacterium]
MKAILEGLNDEQQKAVRCIEGPVLIVAGAGSGKTRVITDRIAYILCGGVPASRVMALTFTKKAAAEMKERVALITGAGTARNLVMGTFHSVFVRFLREFADRLGYPRDFTIYDSSDQLSAMKTCVKELQLDDKTYKPKDVLSRISKAKNNLVTVEAYRANRQLLAADQQGKRPRLVELYDLYQRKLKASGVMDFDDILVNMNILLKRFPDVLESIQDRFSYIMVDEYQDTNFAQYLILKKLSLTHRNICVVGDDSQSIYAFRGAKIENILNFRKDYPESRIFRLERNYRSTRNIVSAANSVIARNEGRIPKDCYSEGETGDRIELLSSYTEAEEAALIVSALCSRMMKDHAQYRDFAVLYRTNSQSRAIEEALRRRNVPYVIYSGNSFFERAEIKDMMAYFKLVVNPDDDESFKRAVNRPARGIGETTVNAVVETARRKGCSLFKAAMEVPKVQPFCRMIQTLSRDVTTEDAFSLVQKIADESGLYAFFKSDTSVEGMARAANVEELVNSVAVFVEEQREREDEVEDRLGDFLENVSLLSNADLNEEEDDSNKVSLMTVHSAKGLEFPYVFIAGLEENLFPNTGMLSSIRDIEEERRLFYVAVTRAKTAVWLSFAATRMRNGKHESNRPSRFISEIDSRYLLNPAAVSDYAQDDGPDEGFRVFGSRTESFRRKSFAQSGHAVSGPAASGAAARPTLAKPDIIDPDFVPVPMTELFEGERVEHNRFGGGVIKSISGVAPEMKAVIVFDNYGEKVLLLKYAKLRPEK